MDENVINAPTSYENDAILPDGWVDGDDFFDDSKWTGSTASAGTTPAATAEDTSDAEDQSDEEKSGEVDAQAESATSEPEASTEGTEPTEEAPATEQTEVSSLFKFQTTIDHETVDVELAQKDIEELYQKAHVVDRVRDKLKSLEPTMNRVQDLAKRLGYQSAEEWLDADIQARRDADIDKLVGEGVHPEVAADIVDRKLGGAPKIDTKSSEAPAESPAPSRDFHAEVEELFSIRPELRGTNLPSEVTQACVKDGKPLTVAYLEYEFKTADTARRQAVKEAEEAKKQLAIATQNAAAAAKAPVTGTSGGGKTDSSPEDDFLKGFNFDSYY